MRHAEQTILLALLTGCSPAVASTSVAAQTPPLPECEWCGTAEAPVNLGSSLVIPTAGETGDRLVIEGTVYLPDGATPAAGVLLYVYHTNAGGVYPKRGNETGNARRHGYLRGWLRTGADGRYRIETIKPGTYPSRSDPAHVHMTLQHAGEPERYIDDLVFEGDPLLTAEHRARLRQRGGSGISVLRRGGDGVFQVTRDIYLGRQ
jgi:protocatechuate 3,4-dioxygenase beta subunit